MLKFSMNLTILLIEDAFRYRSIFQEAVNTKLLKNLYGSRLLIYFLGKILKMLTLSQSKNTSDLVL